ncbi:hypothetical protein ISU07_20735 [Nocardioides islandensis]|uniref:Uncharacterized protein n=1 Tax=Nocardioides islandensis TaxID=433663 RepID=A0A930VIN5_9ACTN|nr:hypothetical protein [Nocardioides islandensis]MBF4765563.1 hypothetical protein [Nocardioides islandensis]
MTKHVYDEEASERLHMDVVHEIDDRPGSRGEWIDAMRRLNSINDPLARSIVALHPDCGTGGGECDSDLDDPLPLTQRIDGAARPCL